MESERLIDAGMLHVNTTTPGTPLDVMFPDTSPGHHLLQRRSGKAFYN